MGFLKVSDLGTLMLNVLYLRAETSGVSISRGHLSERFVFEGDFTWREAGVDLFGEGTTTDVFILDAAVVRVDAF